MNTVSNISEKDYHNAEVIREILIGNDREEVERLRRSHAWTHDQIDVFRHFIRIREQIIEKMRFEIEKRMQKNPVADTYEMNIGAYREQIEPQMRSAIEVLQKKGYGTFSCGFYGRDEQDISFVVADNPFDGWWFDDSYIDSLANRGIHMKHFGSRLCLVFSRKYSQSELAEIWNELVGKIPARKESASMSDTRIAQRFRSAQWELRARKKFEDAHR